MKKEVCFAKFCKAGPLDKRPFVKRSIDESAHCVEFLYLRVCHQRQSVVLLDEILVRRVLFTLETRLNWDDNQRFLQQVPIRNFF